MSGADKFITGLYKQAFQIPWTDQEISSDGLTWNKDNFEDTAMENIQPIALGATGLTGMALAGRSGKRRGLNAAQAANVPVAAAPLPEVNKPKVEAPANVPGKPGMFRKGLKGLGILGGVAGTALLGEHYFAKQDNRESLAEKLYNTVGGSKAQQPVAQPQPQSEYSIDNLRTYLADNPLAATGIGAGAGALLGNFIIPKLTGNDKDSSTGALLGAALGAGAGYIAAPHLRPESLSSQVARGVLQNMEQKTASANFIDNLLIKLAAEEKKNQIETSEELFNRKAQGDPKLQEALNAHQRYEGKPGSDVPKVTETGKVVPESSKNMFKKHWRKGLMGLGAAALAGGGMYLGNRLANPKPAPKPVLQRPVNSMLANKMSVGHAYLDNLLKLAGVQMVDPTVVQTNLPIEEVPMQYAFKDYVSTNPDQAILAGTGVGLAGALGLAAATQNASALGRFGRLGLAGVLLGGLGGFGLSKYYNQQLEGPMSVDEWRRTTNSIF